MEPTEKNARIYLIRMAGALNLPLEVTADNESDAAIAVSVYHRLLEIKGVLRQVVFLAGEKG